MTGTVTAGIKVISQLSGFMEEAGVSKGQVVKWVKDLARKEYTKAADKHNLKKAAKVFGLKGTVSIRPAGEHPAYGNQVTQTSKEVIAGLHSFVDNRDIEVRQKWIDAQVSDNLICIGGPVGNAVTRASMGYASVGDYRYKRVKGFPIDLPMGFDLQVGARTKEIFTLKRGRRHYSRNWGVNTPAGLYVPQNADGALLEDYLLITRMPNILSPHGWEKRRDVLIIAGTHGIGTKGIIHLIQDRKAINELSRKAPARHFQALVAMEDMMLDATNTFFSEKARIDYVERIPFDEARVDRWVADTYRPKRIARS